MLAASAEYMFYNIFSKKEESRCVQQSYTSLRVQQKENTSLLSDSSGCVVAKQTILSNKPIVTERQLVQCCTAKLSYFVI